MRVFSFKLEEELYEMLDAKAMNTGKSRGEIVREALREYFKNHEESVPQAKVEKVKW